MDEALTIITHQRCVALINLNKYNKRKITLKNLERIDLTDYVFTCISSFTYYTITRMTRKHKQSAMM